MQMYVYYVSWASVVILATWRKSYCPNFNNACAMPVVREMMQYSEACDQWLFVIVVTTPCFSTFYAIPTSFQFCMKFLIFYIEFLVCSL